MRWNSRCYSLRPASAPRTDHWRGFHPLSGSLRRRAKEELGLGSVEEAHTGSVLFIQRFDSALRLNVHGHLLSLDGVYLRGADGMLCFQELAEPYELKRAWKDGTRAVVLSPLDLCARVCALIPRPGFNRIRYCGCLSSHAALRSKVVPKPPPAADNPLLDADDDDTQLALRFGEGDADSGAASCTRRRPWAWLLRPVWQVDVSTFPRCGGSMKWVEVATEPDAIRRLLADLKRPRSDDSRVERRTTSRRHSSPPPEQLGLGFG